MPADRSSFATLQTALRERGISSLAIDLRGHGESTDQQGRRLDYRNFSDAEHQQSAEDVKAALAWLESQGFPSNKVGIIGASIGANLALQAATRYSPLATCLLSPGENYRGVLTFDAAGRLRDPQALLAAASTPDDAESYSAAQHVIEQAPLKEKQFVPFTQAGHGTTLFERQPPFVNTVADWLAGHLK